MASGAKTPGFGDVGKLAHVGVAAAAPVVLLALLAADPRWASVQPEPLDPGRSLLASLWMHGAGLLPLLDATHRGELALFASIAVLASLTALIASSLHEGRARPFVAAAASTLVTVSASHWVRFHLAATNRIDHVVPSLVAAVALAGALLSLRRGGSRRLRTTRAVILIAVGAAAGADAPRTLDPWPCLLVVASLLATSWERISARDDASPTTRSSVASVTVSLLALAVAAIRGPWIDEAVATTRPADSFERRVTLTGPPPRDRIVLHDLALRRVLGEALSPTLRPDLEFLDPAQVWAPTPDGSAPRERPPRATGIDPAVADAAGAGDTPEAQASRGLTSDAYWLPRVGTHAHDLDHVHEVGPLFRHDPLREGLINTAPRWVSMSAADARTPALDRAWLTRAALERARFRRATGRPELAITAWPFFSARDPDLRDRLRLAWLVRASMSPARASVTITPSPLRVPLGSLADPVVAHALAEIDAAEFAYELGRDGLARSLVDDAATAGRIEAIVALLRWQAHTGARAAFDENAVTLIADVEGRRYGFDTVHWLLRRGLDDLARALATAAPPREDDAAAHAAALLAANVAAASGGKGPR